MATQIEKVTVERGVSEGKLQAEGLALPEVWAEDCFALETNRLYRIGGAACAAAVLASDFRGFEPQPDGVVEVVAIEVLPAFRGRGLASAILRSFAVDGRLRVNSPSDELMRILSKCAEVVEVDTCIHEVRFGPSAGATLFEIEG
jgi:ribosomal protein S18 acetylase RimI-like enzyme